MEQVPQTATYVELFNQLADDSKVIKFKLNNVDQNDQENFINAKRFVQEELKATILYSSIGLHINGKNKIPHLHYHFITAPFKEPSNVSQKKNRWIQKDRDSNLLPDVSIQISDIDHQSPKYHTLAYPLKEGLYPDVEPGLLQKGFYDYTKKNNKMDRQLIEFLRGVGNEIYNKQLASNDRRDKCEERKQNKLLDLFKLVEDNKHEFHTFRQMLQWLDVNYIDKLEIHELPDSRNYKINCEKIAVKLQYVKYSELIT